MKKINTMADLGAFVRDIRKGQGVSQGIAPIGRSGEEALSELGLRQYCRRH